MNESKRNVQKPLESSKILQENMQSEEFRTEFVNGCIRNGISLPDRFPIEPFETFAFHLLEVNQRMNLTALRTISEVISKHFVDCLLALPDIQGAKTILDIGCGAGFPSVPFAIAEPQIRITALDSTEKKVLFVTETAKMLRLSNLRAVSGRAEEASVRSTLGKFDVVSSRAVAKLSILCELALPYLTIGGKLVALKGAKGEEELSEAKNAIKILGGESEIRRTELRLPNGASEERTIITIQKTAETPPQYPRKYAEIAKKPL